MWNSSSPIYLRRSEPGDRPSEGDLEQEVVRTIKGILSKNITAETHPCFLGLHISAFIPAAVRTIVSRSEFITSYTPYQPEISQGMLQALFEYQSFIAELTGMEAVNSSNYDASTALGEAATMCHRLNSKRRFLVPRAINAERLSVLRNYLRGVGMEVVQYGYDKNTGELDLDEVRRISGDDVSGVYVEVPNFLGVINSKVTKSQRDERGGPGRRGRPVSLGLLAPPADYGADIVIGEGRSLVPL